MASGAYNNAVLPFTDWSWAAIPSWSNYGELGMWVTYGGGSKKVSDLVVSGNVLEFEHAGGPIGVWNRAITYSTCGGDATYILSYVNDIDTDKDGIPNSIENSGFYDSNYNYYKTIYNNPDTDADGLWDGVEAGEFWMVNGLRYYKINSMPTNPDSDSDILNDYIELVNEDTNPLLKDSDDDAWTDGEEVNYVNWPKRTEPLMPDTDMDDLIDSIDPDPLDAGNNTMPEEWHKTEFIQGLILSDISSSDPRHRNEDFQLGQEISQILAVGSARDFIAQANKGVRGPQMLILAVGVIPAGGLAKAEMKAIKCFAKIDDAAVRFKSLNRWGGEGFFAADKMAAIRGIDKEGAVARILAKGGTESGLIRVMDSKSAATATSYKTVSYPRIADTISVEGSAATWKPGKLAEHFIKHKKVLAEKGLIYNTEAEFDAGARALWNRNDANIGRYWDTNSGNIGVLDRQTGAYVAIDDKGIIFTYHVKDVVNDIDNNPGRFIKLN